MAKAQVEEDPYCALSYWPHFVCPDNEAAARVTFYANTGKGKIDKITHVVVYCPEHTNIAMQVALANGYHVKAELIEPPEIEAQETDDDD